MSAAITRRQLLHFKARYHRNGTAGEGFHACSFVMRDGRERLIMTAIVFEGRGQVAVLGPYGIDTRYRGDDFEGALREAIEGLGDAVHEHQGAIHVGR
jgi:hypothetical protein